MSNEMSRIIEQPSYKELVESILKIQTLSEQLSDKKNADTVSRINKRIPSHIRILNSREQFDIND